MLNKIEKEVLSKYKEVFGKTEYPDWSWELPPSIPMVGNAYKDADCKCLVYGSVENLSYLNNNNQQALKDWKSRGEKPFYRHRYCFEGDQKSFFPDVHLQPISDGSLLLAARYILSLLKHDSFSSIPCEFLNEIAIGNFGKFAIKGPNNQDYASNKGFLLKSIEYIKADVETLQPDIIILPRTIYSRLKNNLRQMIKKTTLFYGIYQTQPRAISGVISRQLSPSMDNEIISTEYLDAWLANISRKGLNMTKYLQWLTLQHETLCEELVK